MKTALKNILFPILSAVLLIVVEKVVEKLLEESAQKEDEPGNPATARIGGAGAPGTLNRPAIR